MSGVPNRRRSGMIAALALVLAVAAVYLASRPARPTAGPEPVSAATQAPTESSSTTGEARAPSATAPTPASAPPPARTATTVATVPASATAAAPAAPTRTSQPTSDADVVFVVPTPPPGRAPAASQSPPRRCLQWRGAASDEQRRSNAAALLLAARQNDGVAKAPSASVVRAYRLAITAACGGTDRGDDTVADVARAAYLKDRDRWRL